MKCIKCGAPIEQHDWFMGHGVPTEVRWLHTNGHGTCDRFTTPKEESSEWLVRKAAHALRPGDRFIFADDLGGQGEAVTVEGIANSFGTVEVAVEEFDFTIDLTDKTMVTMATDEEEEP